MKTSVPSVVRRALRLRGIACAALFGGMPVTGLLAQSIWDGGASTTELGTATNWNPDGLPNVAGGIARWDGTVAGPLALTYTTGLGGAPGNVGINLELAATQTGSLSIDSGTSTTSIRINNITLDAGSGAFTLGNGADIFNTTLGGAGGQTHTWTNNSSNAASIASDVRFGMGGGGNHTLALGGTGNWTSNTAIAPLANNLNLLKFGTGTVTLTNGGTLNSNNTLGHPTDRFPMVAREGTLRLTGGTMGVTGEVVVGGTLTHGAANQNATLEIDGASTIMNVSTWLSIGRGNGTGSALSALNLTNGARVNAGNVSAGFNGGSALNFPAGSLSLSGASELTVTGNGEFKIGESSGSNFTATLSGTSKLTGTGTGFKAFGQFGTGVFNLNDTATVSIGGVLYLGYRTGNGTLNQNGGTFTTTGEVRVGGSDLSGTGVNAVGTANFTAGVANLGALTIARGNNNQNTVSGTVNIGASSLVNITDDVILGFAGNNNLGVLTLNGGTLNIGMVAKKWLQVGVWDTSRGELTINSGNLNLYNQTDIRMNSNGTVGANVVNHNGGNVTFYADAGLTVGGTGVLDLQRAGSAASNNTYNLNGGTLTVPQVVSTNTTGTRTFNFNGGTIRPTANSAAFLAIGGGNARLNIRDGGAVVDTNGFNITIGQTLEHSNIGGDNAIDGGLTKTGAGTLTLTGSHTYTGPTSVTGGTLLLDPNTALLNGGGALDVQGATLTMASGAGDRVLSVTDLNLANATIDMKIGESSNDQILASGTTTISGSNTLRLTGSTSPGTYTLIGTAAPLSGSFTIDTSGMAAGFLSFGGSISGNDYVLTVTGNPIPGTAWWKGDVSANWNDASVAPNSNWAGNAAGTIDPGQLPGASTDVIFAASGSANPVTSLGANFTVKSLTFETGSHTVGGANSLTLNGTNGNGNALEVLSGASATLANTSSVWTGRTVVNTGGTLAVDASGALGNASGEIEVNGTLDVRADVTKANLSGNGTITNTGFSPATLTVQSDLASTFEGILDNTGVVGLTKTGLSKLSMTGNSTSNGQITVAQGELEYGDGATAGSPGPAPVQIDAGAAFSWFRSDNVTLANDFTGTGGQLRKAGSGTLTLTGNNSFGTTGTGGLVVNDGKVVLGSATAVPAGIRLALNGTELDMAGQTVSTGGLEGFSPGLLSDSSVGGTSTLTLGGTGNTTYSGSIADGLNGRVIDVVKTGSGTQVLAGNNPYTGGTTINQGILQANASTSFGSGDVDVPGTISAITRLQLGGGVTLANNIEIGYPSLTNFNGIISMPGADDSSAITGDVLVKNSGLTTGTNGGAFHGPTGIGLLTLSGDVNVDAASTLLLFRNGNLFLGGDSNAVNVRNEANLTFGVANYFPAGAAMSLAESDAAQIDLNGFSQTLAGTGGSLNNANAAIITNSSITPATLTLATDPARDYATTVANPTGTFVPIGSLGVNVLDAQTTVAGNLSLVKQGLGTLTVQGLNSFTGDLLVSSGLLVADRVNNVLNPATSALGNTQVARTITVATGATLQFLQGDTLGGATTTVQASLVVEAGGTVINNGNNFTTLGNTFLNGGSILTTGGAVAGYQSYNLLGTIVVGGTSASTLGVSGPGNAFNGFHLDATTTFDVDDATGNASADLVVSAPLVDRNATAGGAGALVKAGPGTMRLTTAATYTGDTNIDDGTLSLTSAHLADGADVRITGSGKLNLDYAGTDTVRGFYINGVLQTTGTWGAIGSGATYQTAAITGTGLLNVTDGATPPASGYSTWATDNGLDGSNNGEMMDPDNDGVSNLLEYVLDRDPLASGGENTVNVETDATHFILTFKRLDASIADVALKVQWSDDMDAPWTDFVTVPAATAGAVTVVENGSNPDDVTVRIPRSLVTDGSLFARLQATK